MEPQAAPRRWGIYLRTTRKALGYGSARELSRRMGISPAMITQVEGGIRRPSPLVTQKEILALVGASPTEQEQVLWGLTFQFRSSVRRLALGVLLHYGTHVPAPLLEVWREIWNTTDPQNANDRQWKLEDGDLVDWLIATTYHVGWDFFDASVEETRPWRDLKRAHEPRTGYTDSLSGQTVRAAMTARLRWPRRPTERQIRIGITDLVTDES